MHEEETMIRCKDGRSVSGGGFRLTGSIGCAILVVLSSFEAGESLAGGSYRGPSSQVPPTGRVPLLCSGQGDADLVLAQAGGLPGEELSLLIAGEPNAPFTMFADTGAGPVFLDGIGTFCLDFGPGLRVLFDGIQDGAPRLGSDGVFIWTVTIPDKPHLRGRTFYLQALIETDDGPDGYAITNQAEFSILP